MARRRRKSLADLLQSNRLAEHQGRVPQPGVPAGPRNSANVTPPSHSGGTSGELTLPHYTPKTPTGAPYDPNEPGHSAQDFAAALPSRKTHSRDYSAALAAIDELVSPILTEGRTIAQTAKAALNLGVQPTPREEAEAVRSPEAATHTLAHVIGGALGHIVSGVQAPKVEAPKQPHSVDVAQRTVPPRNPADPLGKKTLGKATAAELAHAAKTGTLKVNKGGVITTPQARKANRQLRQAWRSYNKKAVPQLSELPSGGGSTEFAKWFAHYSGLDPRIAAGWVLAEGAGESGNTGGEAGLNNWLAAGFPAHKTAFSNAPFFNGSPKEAAKATAEWMEGKIGDEYGYPVSSGIANAFRQFKGKSPEEQAKLIASSGWVDGQEALNQGYYDSIVSNAQSVEGSGSGQVPPALASRLQNAQAQARALGISLPSEEQQRVNYIKVFGKQVGHELALVRRGEFDKGKGTLVLDSGVSIEQGHEPEIAARLKLLSAKIGKPVYIISGYRSPQHSVEVGGFSDDPHTEGEAADIGIGSPTLESAGSIPESVYESVGLHRPFYPESAHEVNHVQLLNNGTPSFGNEGGATTGAVGGSALGPAGAISGGTAAGSSAAGKAAVGGGRPVSIGEVPIDEILSPDHNILAEESPEGIIQQLIDQRRIR